LIFIVIGLALLNDMRRRKAGITKT
jgi:hypothetical protein